LTFEHFKYWGRGGGLLFVIEILEIFIFSTELMYRNTFPICMAIAKSSVVNYNHLFLIQTLYQGLLEIYTILFDTDIGVICITSYHMTIFYMTCLNKSCFVAAVVARNSDS